MRTTDTPEQVCAGCGELNDRASSLFGGRGPKPGDLSICLTCGFVTQFDEGLRRRQLTDEELDALPPEALQMIMHINRARQRAGMPPWRFKQVLNREGRS